MTASELVIFTGLYIFAIFVLPLIFIVFFDKEEVIKPFDTPRITLGFDITDEPDLPYDHFSLMPI